MAEGEPHQSINFGQNVDYSGLSPSPVFPSASVDPKSSRNCDIVDFSDGCCDSKVRTLYCEGCGRPYYVVIGCHSRFASQCPECAAKWVRAEKRKAERAIAAMRAPKFLTLTLCKSQGEEKNKERLWSAKNALFHRIRRAGYQVRSHYEVVEFPNHMHIVVDCDYIPQYLLSQWWKGVTGDSFIVDIRKLSVSREGPRKVAGYLSKYITKGSHTNLPLAMLKGFHMVNSWHCSKVPVSKRPLCDCGHCKMRVLPDYDADGYISWWENNPGPPAG